MSLGSWLNQPRLILRVVGWVGVLFSLFGLYSHKVSLEFYSASQQPPDLRTVYYTMAGINIAITLAAFGASAGLTRGWVKWVPFFVGVQFVVLLDFVVPGLLWGQNTHFSHAVASATGISSAGTAFFLITLYPFWGSLAAVWAAHRLGTGQPDARQ